MSQQELVRKVIATLESLGIAYMVTGSVVSSIQGEPRTTHDIDIVVLLEPSDADPISAAFPAADYYCDPMSIRRAIAERSMFNVIDMRDGNKIDFWLLKDTEFDRSRFARRRPESLLGCRMTTSSPEDTILAKLDWAKRSGGSEKQFVDALRIYEVQYRLLDMSYLTAWVARLGVDSLWEQLKRQAEI